VREAGFHTPPGRLLAVWLDGQVEFETSDGEVRRVTAGKAVLVEDRTGRDISRAIRWKGWLEELLQKCLQELHTEKFYPNIA
jgi:hypothetical protein